MLVFWAEPDDLVPDPDPTEDGLDAATHAPTRTPYSSDCLGTVLPSSRRTGADARWAENESPPTRSPPSSTPRVDVQASDDLVSCRRTRTGLTPSLRATTFVIASPYGRSFTTLSRSSMLSNIAQVCSRGVSLNATTRCVCLVVSAGSSSSRAQPIGVTARTPLPNDLLEALLCWHPEPRTVLTWLSVFNPVARQMHDKRRKVAAPTEKFSDFHNAGGPDRMERSGRSCPARQCPERQVVDLWGGVGGTRCRTAISGGQRRRSPAGAPALRQVATRGRPGSRMPSARGGRCRSRRLLVVEPQARRGGGRAPSGRSGSPPG